MKRILYIIMIWAVCTNTAAQERIAQNKPYIDLRPLHFGILVGMHLQDIEFQNVGPQIITEENGAQTTQTILCDADNWNPGFSVGVTAEMRINDHLSARFTPTMHFGAKHLVFRNLSRLDDNGMPTEVTQDMKNTYITLPIDLKFSAQRFNNHRPYIMAGISPAINLTGKAQDYIRLKRYDTFVEIGLGCDFYLPFFKLIPELKFCYSLSNALDKNHANELQDTGMKAYANSVTAGHSKMIVLTFYFE
ncbi:MAG: porin family protein [Prevotella sp.]|uniref:type IX secretion/gliding motility protein PorT/SprT n=1 Tax=Prevotella sp. PTAC TaxID=2736295 RepID=UPI001557DA65|nr:porin family protein [Prevotella sp. PTAC]MCX4293597.1 porin family protein [Prevotella sp.]NPD55026.1 PorT family protein [Prevotella sp. PTAC]